MTTKQSLLAIWISSAVTASACGGGSSNQNASASAPAQAPAVAPAPAPEPQPAAPPTEAAPAPKAKSAPSAAVAVRPPSFMRTDTKIGTGKEAIAGNRISVHYTGWLYDVARPDHKGQQFDSSVERKEPFTFTLGAGQVIPGWDQGFVGMKVGGKRTLLIPPDMGYGASGFGGGIIPPNATLIFETELLDVAQ